MLACERDIEERGAGGERCDVKERAIVRCVLRGLCSVFSVLCAFEKPQFSYF